MPNLHVIDSLDAREILDSRGNPTVEVSVTLASGIITRASVPAGASTGSHEAFELRDGDPKRYGGRGVLMACENVRSKISRALKNIDITQQRRIDQELIELDGTANLRKLGANAVLGASLACARAAAYSKEQPLYHYLREVYVHVKGSEPSKNERYTLPVPLFNIFNGGKHADTNLDFQEFIVIPAGVKGGFSEQVRAGAEIFHELKHVLYNHGLDTDVGSEGGYAPNIDSTIQALDMIMTSITESGYTPGEHVFLGTDVGASVLYNHDKNMYHFGLLDHDMDARQLISLYADWAREYPFMFIEDGLAEDDWEHWRQLTDEFIDRDTKAVHGKYNRDMLITGDDLFVSQVGRLDAGIDQGVANSAILKPNQVGTLTQTMEFAKRAQENHYRIIVSHRSGETTDDFISDLAVAINAEFIKAGSLARGERVVKYNRLMDIERELTV